MKKIASIILIIMLLVCTFASVGFAAEEKGSITITNVTVKQEDGVYKTPSTYTAYQMLELESYNEDTGLYNYKVTDEWADFFKQDDVKAYFVENANGYIEWKSEVGEDIKARAAEVSQLALVYAENNNLVGNKGFTIDLDTIHDDSATGLTVATIVLKNLDLGYYLVDSSAGALCGLTTTNPNASFSAKNFAPTVDKQVKEDGIVAESEWGDTNDADIGQEIEFDSTIIVRSGAENYIFHDKMSEGLEFIGITSITHQTSGENHILDPKYYTIINNPTDCEDDCTFEIVFTEDFHKHVNSGDRIIILYKARLTEDAVIGNDGNPNEVWLHYGDNSESTHDVTITKTYGFDLVKTTTDHKLLPGAKFKIYRDAECTDAKIIKFVKLNGYEGTTYDVYRIATSEDIKAGTAVYEELEVTNGCIRIIGLDKDHYFLKETVAPNGYNLLKAPKEISLEFDNYLQFEQQKPLTNTGFQVVNQAGSILPETGATGIKIFVGVGMFTVIASGLLLVTKKRMSMIED